MLDGSRLRQSWCTALDDAESHFRQLLTASGHSDWKRISLSTEASSKKGKTRVSAIPELTDVIVHRHTGRLGDDVYRMVLDVGLGDEGMSLESWKAVLTTPELRQEWDPAVDESHLLEMFDHRTRISKTNFTIGWPANPRDAITISRLIHDANTVIDISTSLPRSSDEPAYLRPSPPFVRSHVKLFAWCIQLIPPSSNNDDSAKKRSNRLRMTCFWQHDLKALWGFGSSPSSMAQQLSTMTLSLFKTVLKRGGRVAKLSAYGNGVSIERIRYQIDREALNLEYTIIPEEDEHTTPIEQVQGMEEVHALREQRRLTRSIECLLPSVEGWDVQVTTKASSEETEKLPWSAAALRTTSVSSSSQDQIILRFTHAALPDSHSVLKVKISIEVAGGTRGIHLNGLPKPIVDMEERNPSSHFISQPILQDIASTADLSFNSSTSVGTHNSNSSTSSLPHPMIRTSSERSVAADKSILSRVRRNYIYFSSLLQEPEAKWRRTTEARGVSITQLDSIDPTLVVYRAEATFVGVNLWDLFAAVVTPGTRVFWDKQYEDSILLEDVNELTELWHWKTKPAWPVNGRDCVLLKTVYKSPTTIHVFSFSADDSHLFPHIPPPDPNIIRTQVDLQGWSIEALSPTTTQLTLLEQSDPKGWTNKTSIPTQMINTLAGIGEFVIKSGGPPTVTRLTGAKANDMRYDHERMSFKVEYEAAVNRRSDNGEDESDTHSPAIELEIRCDIDTWAPSLDIIVDPPPQTISCLRRHRLSAEGGGLWLTLAHDALFVDDERLLTIVRKAPGKEKGLVMVNGAKIQVDVEELPEHEIKALTKQKRVKPVRIPLDQPPIVGNIKKKRAELDDDNGNAATTASIGNAETQKPVEKSANAWATAPRISSPLARFITYYVDQATTTTQQAVAAIAPTSTSGDNTVPSPSKLPFQYALEALSWVQDTHGQTLNNDWVLVADKGMLVHRKLVPEVSSIIPVHRGSKVIEGVSAEELAPVITHWDCRRKWDDRFDSVKVFESFGAECQTAFVVSKAGFPFRDRGFYLASVVVRGSMTGLSLSRQISSDGSGNGGPGTSTSLGMESGNGGDHSANGARRPIYCVSASFSPESVPSFPPAKYNSYSLPIGRVYVDAWVLETLDPYTKENYMIPSTRCTRYIAVDFAGSIPAAVNSMINASVPRCILAVEAFIKGSAPLPVMRLPAPSLIIGSVGRKEEEMFMGVKASAWRMKRRDEDRVLIAEKFEVESRVFKACILVQSSCLSWSSNGKGRSVSVNASSGITSDKDRHGESHASTPTQSKIIIKSASPSEKSGNMASVSSEATITPVNVEGVLSANSSMHSTLSVSPPTSSIPQQAGTLSSVISVPSSAPPVLEEHRRGRSVSVFTMRKDIRPHEVVIAEMVVDKKMYPNGYEVKVKSKTKKDIEVKLGQKGYFLPLLESQMDGFTVNGNILPLEYSISTIPPSPMHSSGEAGTRHLLRVLLSNSTPEKKPATANEVTAESKETAEDKPLWLNDVVHGGGAVIWVEIAPVINSDTSESQTPGPADASKGTPKKGKRDASRKRRDVVIVDGNEISVLDEKESLTSFGRDKLMDDRVGKMNVISRIPNDSEALPNELRTPVGIAYDLCETGNPTASAPSNTHGNEQKDEISEASEPRSEEGSKTDEESATVMGEKKEGKPHVNHAPNGAGGLLGFLQSYPNPLTRFGMSMGGSGLASAGDKVKETGSPASVTSPTAVKQAEMLTVPRALTNESNTHSQSGGTNVQQMNVQGQMRSSVHPMSTLIVVALIAFLLGSLLRSLISPADFVYLGEMPPQADSSGWREIRRLVELKYVFGGWDLQIAVVRRHQ